MTQQLQQEEGEGGGFSACGRREAASCLGGCYGERTPAVRSLPEAFDMDFEVHCDYNNHLYYLRIEKTLPNAYHGHIIV